MHGVITKIMVGNKTDNIIKELFESFLDNQKQEDETILYFKVLR